MVQIAARYDAAQTTPDNARHWAMADGLSAGQANTSGVRWLIRNRSRYEHQNNSYLAGMAQTLAVDTVGTGPRFQLKTKNTNANQRVEATWRQWAQETCLATKLQMARITKMIDGEVFAIFFTDNSLASPIKLNFSIVPAEHFSRPVTGDYADGIEYDRNGKPIRYWASKKHPSEGGYDPQPIPARWVAHYAHMNRPGMLRGIPETTPALPLFANLRRFTLATIGAAETAASMAAVLKSLYPPDQNGKSSLAALTELEIIHRMMVMLPDGVEMQQFKAEHPTTTYEMFKRAILEEIARCMSMPYNIAAGNSGGYNYASGRLDVQVYARSVNAERHRMEQAILRPIWIAWADDAVLVPGLLPFDQGPYALWDTRFYWPGWKHVDPVKEAVAQEKRLANFTTTLEAEWAEQGEDWETMIDQRARELKKLKSAGLTDTQAMPKASSLPRKRKPQKEPANV